MNVSRLSFVALTLATFVAVAGCGHTGSRSGKPVYGPGSTGNIGGGSGGGGNPTTVTLTLGQAPATPAVSTLMSAGAKIPVLTLRLTNGGAADIAVSLVRVTASGSADESTVLTSASLTEDANGNAQFDQGETVFATAAPPFAVNDGTVDFATNGLTVAAGASRDLLLYVETVALTGMTSDTAYAGKTLVFAVSAATDVQATSSGGQVTVAGVPFTGTTVTLGIGTHLLISEIGMAPGSLATSGEFIEIFNPTGAAVPLDNYHLTDFTSSSNAVAYFRMPTGANFFDTTNADDFSVRFPANSSIASGQTIVIAVDGAGFTAVYGNVTPNFVLRNPVVGSNVPRMRVWDGVTTPPNLLNFATGDVGANVGLSNTGEIVVLFTWNGQANPAPDLVSDVDIVNYGGTSANNTSVDKSGEAIDTAFDNDQATSTYLAETNPGAQDLMRAPVVTTSGRTCTRIAWNEGTETTTNGNGVTGHDETSENLNVTFASATASPGQP